MYLFAIFLYIDPLWSNISHQWANMGSMSNNMTDLDFEKLFSSVQNVVDTPGVYLAAAGGAASGAKKKHVVSCIPEPSE